MQEIEWKRSRPVTKEVDVCVVGGGPAGIAAAVTAARMGAKVFLAEKQQCFGGAATLSSVPAFMRFSDGGHFLLGELLCGKLLKSRRHNIGVPAFEEYQVPGRLRAAVFFQGKINAVLLSGGRKCPDVVVGDLQVRNSCVVFHQLL